MEYCLLGFHDFFRISRIWLFTLSGTCWEILQSFRCIFQNTLKIELKSFRVEVLLKNLWGRGGEAAATWIRILHIFLPLDLHKFSIWDAGFSCFCRTKFAFVFRNEKIESAVCSLKVYCKHMLGAYCHNYRLQMYNRNIATNINETIWHWQEICNANLIYPRQIEFQQELVIELTYQNQVSKEDSLACGIYYNCTRTKIHHQPYYGNPNTSTTTTSTTSTTEQKTSSFLTSTIRGPTSESRKLIFFSFSAKGRCILL